MPETITIPKEEYKNLMQFKRIVELEYDKPLSKYLLKKLEEAGRDIKAGKGVALHSSNEVQQYFKSM